MVNNFEKRETYTTTTIDGREFIINAYDPMIGNYLLMQIITFVLPLGLGDMISNQIKGSEKVLSKVENKPMMSKADFISFQTDILSTVYERYKSGEKSPVVRENGTYGIENVTMNLCLRLIISSLAFNFKDFFEGVPFQDILT